MIEVPPVLALRFASMEAFLHQMIHASTNVALLFLHFVSFPFAFLPLSWIDQFSLGPVEGDIQGGLAHRSGVGMGYGRCQGVLKGS